jgi:DNA-binding Xre family transcriptional regulator
LRFNNIKHEKMLVERRLEVKKKKNVSGLAMKTLEATISKVDKDEDTNVSLSLPCRSARILLMD